MRRTRVNSSISCRRGLGPLRKHWPHQVPFHSVRESLERCRTRHSCFRVEADIVALCHLKAESRLWTVRIFRIPARHFHREEADNVVFAKCGTVSMAACVPGKYAHLVEIKRQALFI